MAVKKVSTTRMSSKGQVVIPESVRSAMGLAEGAEFLVVCEGDFVVLKAISANDMDGYKKVVVRANKAASRAIAYK